MNKKGFSLVELLAVLVILGLILAIAVPNVVEFIDSFDEKNRIEMLEKSAISAAKEYVADVGLNNSNIDLTYCNDGIDTFAFSVKIEDLIGSNYLDDDVYYSNKTIDVEYDCINKKVTRYSFNSPIVDDFIG